MGAMKPGDAALKVFLKFGMKAKRNRLRWQRAFLADRTV